MTGAAVARRNEDSIAHQQFIHFEKDLEGLNPHQVDFSPEYNENNDERAIKQDEKITYQFLRLIRFSSKCLLNSDALISEPELEHVGLTKKSRSTEVSRSGLEKFMLKKLLLRKSHKYLVK